MTYRTPPHSTKDMDTSSVFEPPSAKLAAVTRKGNELCHLIETYSKDVNHIQSLLEEYNSKVNVLEEACDSQILHGGENDKRKEWRERNFSFIINVKISIHKYLQGLSGAVPRRKVAHSIISKASELSSRASNSSSARIRLAEKKAKLEAEKAYNNRLKLLQEEELQTKQKLQEEQLKTKQKLEEEELKMKLNTRAAEIEKMEIEQNTFENELIKLDHVANDIENLFSPPTKLYKEHDELFYSNRSDDQHEQPEDQYERIIDQSEDLEDRQDLYRAPTGKEKGYFMDSKPRRDKTAEYGSHSNTLYEVLQKQNEISLAMVKHQEKAELPKRELPKFDGSDVTLYREFIQAFNLTIDRKCEDVSDKFYFLLQYTSGTAHTIVKSCNQRNPMAAYRQALKSLEEEYGNEHKTATAYLEKLERWPAVKSEDGKSLQELAIFLLECQNNMQNMTVLNQLNSHKEIKNVIEKLPFELRKRWREKTFYLLEKDNPVNFTEVVKFIRMQARLINQPLFGQIKDYRINKIVDRDNRKERKVLATQLKENNSAIYANTEEIVTKGYDKDKNCVYCKKKNHDINYCHFFKGITYENRVDFVKKNGLCFGCLKEGHSSRGCYKRSTCNTCSKRHPTLLHRSSNVSDNKRESETQEMKRNHKPEQNKVETKEQENSIKSCAVKPNGDETGVGTLANKRVLCAVVPVRVRAPGTSTMVDVYAALDTCSSGCFMKDELLLKLGIRGQQEYINVTTMRDSSSMKTKVVNNVELYDMKNNKTAVLPVVFAQNNWPFDGEDTPRESDLESLNIPFTLIDADIDLIIGMNCPDIMKPWKVIDNSRSCVYGTLHQVGWAVNGVTRDEQNKTLVNRLKVQAVTDIEKKINDMYQEDYKDSHLTIKEMSQDDMEWQKIMVKTCKLDADNHYEIDLPIKGNLPHDNNNRNQAYQSFKSLLKKLTMNKELYTDYCDFMKMMKYKGFMEEIPGSSPGSGTDSSPDSFPDSIPDSSANNSPDNSPDSSANNSPDNFPNSITNNSPDNFPNSITNNSSNSSSGSNSVPSSNSNSNVRTCWYLTHHAVYHKEKKKIRIVFNCSLRNRNVSLNDILYQGPDLTNNLLGVIMRFRQEKIAFTGDIEKMFYQVRVTPACRDYLRFFWIDDNCLDKIREYRLTVHVFGATSSPSVANYALRQTVVDNCSYSESAKTVVMKNFYVDDMLCSVDNVEIASKLLLEVRALVAEGGFNITGFVTNSLQLTDIMEKAGLYGDLKFKDISISKTDRALGLIWDVDSDKLKVKLDLNQKPITKRGILSVIHGLYDPLGLTSPIMITAKKIFQDSCNLNIEWDSELPVDFKNRWNKWYSELHLIKEFKIDRCCKPFDADHIELHYFCDGSSTAYGVIVYARFLCGNKIHCSPIIAKVRLNPSKTSVHHTVPRIELNGAKLAVVIDQTITNELEYEISSKYFWTDSTAVLNYINCDDKQFPRFVANRISFIRSNSEKSQWYYVPSNLNPADHVSRGVTVSKFLTLDLWHHGPPYLWQTRDFWPKRFSSNDCSTDELEVKTKKACLVTKVEFNSSIELLLSCSSWYKTKKRVAWFVRFKYYLLNRNTVTRGKLSCDELSISEREIIKYIQNKHYHEDIERLRSGKRLTKSSTLSKLNPYLDHENLLRVGGRLQRAHLSSEILHPVIMPAKERLVMSLIEECHRLLGHMGRETLVSYLRRKYWIVGLTSAVRTIMFNCVICRRQNAQPCYQEMAPLPQDRVTGGDPAFTRTGVDYFGPFEVVNGRKTEKRYGVVFSCLNSRAIHIEMAYNLTTNSFLNALRRFMSRRGNVKLIRSDNGTNLVSGCREMKQMIKNWNVNNIQNYLQQRNIEWIFQPPTASHFGGVFEREIRSIRKVLQSILQEQPLRLSDEHLNTLFCEVESILNCRPLTEQSQSMDDFEALTPNHLLLLHAGVTYPPGLFSKNDNYHNQRWKQVQYLADLFWGRWRREYLPLLQARQKWVRRGYQYKVGDLVLLTDQLLPRNQWSLGRIVEVYPDSKDTVRVVKVKVVKCKEDKNRCKVYDTVELKRPVAKLILIASV